MESVALIPFYEFALILILAAIFGFIGQLLKQPLIVVFIALGILVGPSALDLVASTDNIDLLSQLGIAILLFLVGLKLDLNLIRSKGKVAITTGLGQVIFTSVVGFLLCLTLKYNYVTALYIAIALTFSSTIIIVKLLSDKKEIDSLHGQIAIGFLIVQDLVVVFLMIALTAFDKTAEGQLFYSILKMLGRGVAVLAVFAILSAYVLPKLVQRLAKTQELLILFAIAWAITAAAISDMIGFSREVGAFMAGVSLASSPYRNIITGRMISLRDFLLLFFFIHLGLHLNLGLIGDQILPALILSLFVLVGNPLVVLIIMGLMGYRKRTSFLAGLTVAQISEFSLIFATLGYTLGHINQEAVGLITLVGLITIGLSTYMIIYSHQLYTWLLPILGFFERGIPYREDNVVVKQNFPLDVILIGLGRFGSSIAHTLQHENYNFVAVDFDPKQVKFWQNNGVQAQYGDMEDPDLPEQLPLDKTKVVVSSIADVQLNLGLIRMLKYNNFNGEVAVTAHRALDAQTLKKEGNVNVLLPFTDAAGSIPKKLFKQEQI